MYMNEDITNVSCKDNSKNLAIKKKSEAEFRNAKRPLKINNARNNSNRKPIKTFNRFDCLSEESLNEIPGANDSNAKSVSRNKSGKSNTQEYNSRLHRRKENQKIDNSIKTVTALVGNFIIQDLKGWEIADKENKLVVRHVPGEKTDKMKLYLILQLVTLMI